MADRVRAERDRSLAHSQDVDPVEQGRGQHLGPSLALAPGLGQLAEVPNRHDALGALDAAVDMRQMELEFESEMRAEYGER